MRDKIKESSEVIEVDHSDNEDVDTGVTRAQVATLCEQLERLSIKFASTSLDLPKQLRKFRAHLHREDMLKRLVMCSYLKSGTSKFKVTDLIFGGVSTGVFFSLTRYYTIRFRDKYIVAPSLIKEGQSEYPFSVHQPKHETVSSIS